jgi:hypothetical protein
MNNPSFNFKKAIQINPSPFKAFDAGDEHEPLSKVMESGDVHPDQTLLVVERHSGILALDRQEMSYHHVAQGEFNRRPWLVSF